MGIQRKHKPFVYEYALGRAEVHGLLNWLQRTEHSFVTIRNEGEIVGYLYIKRKKATIFWILGGAAIAIARLTKEDLYAAIYVVHETSTHCFFDTIVKSSNGKTKTILMRDLMKLPGIPNEVRAHVAVKTRA